ncbi:hypothetical protein DIZ27_38295 [Streptomyces sp. NWU339]|nr:hypothetical protein DIZ27_38295 [Streptomyces sp. NWU339]
MDQQTLMGVRAQGRIPPHTWSNVLVEGARRIASVLHAGCPQAAQAQYGQMQPQQFAGQTQSQAMFPQQGAGQFPGTPQGFQQQPQCGFGVDGRRLTASRARGVGGRGGSPCDRRDHGIRSDPGGRRTTHSRIGDGGGGGTGGHVLVSRRLAAASAHRSGGADGCRRVVVREGSKRATWQRPRGVAADRGTFFTFRALPTA